MISKGESKLIHDTSEALRKWYSFFSNGENAEARECSQSIVDKCKTILKAVHSDTNMEEINIRNEALVIGIFFRALQDFLDLSETLKSSKWGKDNQLYEKAWVIMWDCKQRLEYSSNFLRVDGKVSTRLTKTIGSLEKFFVSNFGQGLYASPEIIFNREICNICNKDFRACNHTRGNLYDGIRCITIPDDIKLASISIVRVPEDPRCRIWPWNVYENRKAELMLMSTFRIDDFLDEEK